ncbi:bifunctional tRNA (5-methylaminomethyl-2-thiouridine)(34)-methyltransferase MnmD/FAD-dependent 5-carboxymethylaminomethyl-2-thiouridine(34) oxidoreductase MnmC, partial [Pseudomonas sp. MWU13-2860]
SWVAIGDEGSVAIGSVVILAGAAETGAFDATQHLPLKQIPGQVTVARATTQSEALRTVLCGEGYISPARFGEHCLGATFKFNTEDLGVNLFEHQENLHMLAVLAPSVYTALGGEALLEKALSGRASLRCTSPDYLPIGGPVAHAQSLIDTYLALSKDATLQLNDA